jgi:dihydrofolate synthase/folylpolyglutamate synthase
VTLSYAEAVATLEQAMVFGMHPSLEGITALTAQLGRPQEHFRSIQVTGTNGKTSVTRMIAALLHAHGARVLTYTSPHLESYTERIEIGGVPVDEVTFARAAEAAMDAANAVGGDLTEFELLTAAALWLARERGCEWAVLEVGMGGRWDATSVVSPAVAVVTGVGLDHTDRLGDTVEAIAFDKAHIIKPGSVAVLGPATESVREVFMQRALGVGAQVAEVRGPGAASSAWTFELDSLPTAPGGLTRLTVHGPMGSFGHLEVRAPSYQAPNVATAVAGAVAALGHALDPQTARAVLAAMTFPGRFEVVNANPLVVLDGAHNPQGAGVLAGAVEEAWPSPGHRPLALIGVLSDKDAEGIVRALAPVVSGFACTAPDSDRAISAADLAQVVRAVTGAACPTVDIEDVDLPWVRDNAPDAGLLVSGSLYTAGQLRAPLLAPERVHARVYLGLPTDRPR